MPPFIPCGNTFCDGRAEKLGGLCRECQKIADEQKAKQEANAWRYTGFDRTTDQHRRGYRGGKP